MNIKISPAVKISFALFLLLLLSFKSEGQHSNQVNTVDSWIYKEDMLTNEKLGLRPLTTTPDNFHFRLHLIGDVIDIWTNDYITFKGTQAEYWDRQKIIDRDSQPQLVSTFVRKIEIGADDAKTIYNLVQSIRDIPTDKAINKWWTGCCDGHDFGFEMCVSGSYGYKSYFAPGSQDSSICEAKLICGFIDSVRQILCVRERQREFYMTLPKPGRYNNGGGYSYTTYSRAGQRKLVRYYRRKERYEKHHPDE